VVSSILGTSQRLVGSCQDCTAAGEALAIRTFPKFPILHLRHEAARWCMIAGHCARSDSSQLLLPFQGSVLQNTDHVACQYAQNVLYWSLAHNCRKNQKDCVILLAAQAQCAELLKWPTYLSSTSLCCNVMRLCVFTDMNTELCCLLRLHPQSEQWTE